MAVFKSTNRILSPSWIKSPSEKEWSPINLPPTKKWDRKTNPKFYDIKLWEEIYFQPGLIGIYVAWDPYVDLYAIIYYPFLHTKKGKSVFYGENACQEVIRVINQLGINAPITKIWKT